MRKAEFPFLADWFAISLRWLCLIGILAALARSETLNSTTGIVLGFSILWNLFVSVIAVFNRRLKAHRLINVLIDCAVSMALYISSGALNGPLVWAGMLTILSASIYYEWYGSLISALLFPLLEGGWEFANAPETITPLTLGILIGLYLVIGLILGAASHLLMKKLRENYRSRIQQRDKTNRELKKTERERIQAFYRMIEELSATLNYQVVIDAVLDLSAKIFGETETIANEMVSAVMLFDGRNLKVMSARRFPPRDMKIKLPADTGAVAKAIETGEPQIVDNPAHDPELKNLIILQDCKVAFCLPLIRGLNAYGIILYAHTDPEFFSKDKCELLEMISNQAVVSIQNARLYQEVQEEKERIVQSQEKAQKKLARDLHDGPTQSVSAIAMRVNVVRKMLELDTGDPEAELEKIENLARRTTKEIRHMLFTLRPLALESEGLQAALQTMADKMAQTFQQNVEIDIDPAVVDHLELGKQTVVFYLSEEAVNNARKHAQAELIMVRLKFHAKEPDIAVLEIMDNGVGFDIDAVTSTYEQRGSLGMINLQERTDLVNGLLKIDSIPNKGTRVKVQIPLNESAADMLHRGLIDP